MNPIGAGGRRIGGDGRQGSMKLEGMPAYIDGQESAARNMEPCRLVQLLEGGG
jgi:hypothetical protein